MRGVTMDAGALMALERNDRRVIVLIARALDLPARVTVPATAFAQAMRQPAGQAHLARLARQPTTDLAPLDRVDTTQVGILLAASGISDVVEAHAVVCARRAGQPIVTSDPEDLRSLDPAVQLVALS
jgi:hypothetical protein